MNSEIVTLIGLGITGGCTVLGNYFIYIKRARTDLAENAKKEQKQNDRLENIEKKLDEHNKYALIFKKNAEDIADIKSDNRLMQKDIENIKEEIKNVQMCKIK